MILEKLCAPIIFLAFLRFSTHILAEDMNTVKISNEFAWTLFQTSVVHNKTTENFVLSPPTVQMLLSFLQYAAVGSTKRQIQQVTNNIQLIQLYNILYPVGITTEIMTANGIFIDSNNRINENTSLQIIANGGDVFMLPLENDPMKSKQIINKWASNATDGHISQFLAAENDISRVEALLVSAIYFHSSWKHQFRSSQPRLFYSLSNKGILTDYMELTSYFKMRSVDVGIYEWCTVINLPYKENRYSLFLIVPGPLITLKTLVEKINYQKFTDIIRNPSMLPSTKLRFFMPRFKVSSKVSLVSSLQKMGLTDIFSPSQSGLTKLIDGKENIHINDILQKSTFEVDEFGTTATSVTGIFAVPLSAAELEPKVFVIDTPFLAVIVDTLNETPIFISKITNPTTQS